MHAACARKPAVKPNDLDFNVLGEIDAVSRDNAVSRDKSVTLASKRIGLSPTATMKINESLRLERSMGRSARICLAQQRTEAPAD